jgi:hypothetical protein
MIFILASALLFEEIYEILKDTMTLSYSFLCFLQFKTMLADISSKVTLR